MCVVGSVGLNNITDIIMYHDISWHIPLSHDSRGDVGSSIGCWSGSDRGGGDGRGGSDRDGGVVEVVVIVVVGVVEVVVMVANNNEVVAAVSGEDEENVIYCEQGTVWVLAYRFS